MKDCFLRPDGSITNMESMSPCTTGLEETVQKALYHPGISDPGEMITVQHLYLTDHIISAVLITGGPGGYGATKSAEIYHPGN